MRNIRDAYACTQRHICNGVQEKYSLQSKLKCKKRRSWRVVIRHSLIIQISETRVIYSYCGSHISRQKLGLLFVMFVWRTVRLTQEASTKCYMVLDLNVLFVVSFPSFFLCMDSAIKKLSHPRIIAIWNNHRQYSGCFCAESTYRFAGYTDLLIPPSLEYNDESLRISNKPGETITHPNTNCWGVSIHIALTSTSKTTTNPKSPHEAHFKSFHPAAFAAMYLSTNKLFQDFSRKTCKTCEKIINFSSIPEGKPSPHRYKNRKSWTERERLFDGTCCAFAECTWARLPPHHTIIIATSNMNQKEKERRDEQCETHPTNFAFGRTPEIDCWYWNKTRYTKYRTKLVCFCVLLQNTYSYLLCWVLSLLLNNQCSSLIQTVKKRVCTCLSARIFWTSSNFFWASGDRTLQLKQQTHLRCSLHCCHDCTYLWGGGSKCIPPPLTKSHLDFAERNKFNNSTRGNKCRLTGYSNFVTYVGSYHLHDNFETRLTTG